MGSGSAKYHSEKDRNNEQSFFRFKSDRLIFIICICIASLFWLLIKLSDDYTVNYSFKVSYNNVPAELRLTKVVDSTLNLNLTARGFAILRMNLFEDMENLNINLDNYSIEHKGGLNYTINTNELSQNFADLIGVSENDIHFSRTTLTFEMEKTGEKRVQVVPDYSLNFVNQYDLYSAVTADPAYIMVYGPKKVLDTIKEISTKHLVLENLMSDQTVKVELENPNPDLLSFNVDNIKLNFKVDKFTESDITVSINVSNLPYKIKTFPSQVKVFYRVAQVDFNVVRSHQFNIYPVINSMDALQANKLQLKLSKQPDFVRNVRIVPADVEFLIIK